MKNYPHELYFFPDCWTDETYLVADPEIAWRDAREMFGPEVEEEEVGFGTAELRAIARLDDDREAGIYGYDGCYPPYLVLVREGEYFVPVEIAKVVEIGGINVRGLSPEEKELILLFLTSDNVETFTSGGILQVIARNVGVGNIGLEDAWVNHDGMVTSIHLPGWVREVAIDGHPAILLNVLRAVEDNIDIRWPDMPIFAVGSEIW